MATGIFGQKLVEGVNADRRGGKLRERIPELDIGPAIKALDEFGGVLQQNIKGEEQNIETEKNLFLTDVETEKDEQLGDLDIQEQKATQRTESAVSEARRQADELTRGIQSRFGSTTGTGAFSSELIGREALRNVGQNRVALQETISQIDNERTALKRRVLDITNAANTRVVEAKATLRRELRERLAEINVQKGMLEVQKSQARLGVLTEAARVSASLEAQNKQFKQQLFMNFLDKDNQLQRLRASAANSFDVNVVSPNFSKLAEQGFSSARNLGVF